MNLYLLEEGWGLGEGNAHIGLPWLLVLGLDRLLLRWHGELVGGIAARRTFEQREGSLNKGILALLVGR